MSNPGHLTDAASQRTLAKMLTELARLFAADGFMPHGHCYLWQPSLVWLHVGSDTIIGLSYVAISITLYHLVRIIRIPFSAITLSFGVFIGACSLTHFVEVWNLWHSNYWWGGIIKALTGVASATTALWLIRLKPRIVAVGQAAEIAEQRRVELEGLNDVLKQQTAELQRKNDLLRDQTKMLVHSAKLSALGEMAGGLAHEVNTPLAIIQLHAQQLQRGAIDEGRCVQAVLRSAEPIACNVQRIGNIIKGLQLFAREGEAENYEETLAAGLVDDVLLLCRERMASQQIDLQVDYGPLNLRLYCSPPHISQVLLAVLLNAIEAASRAATRWIAIAVAAHDGMVTFAITDSGPGIPAHLHTRLMQPFFTTKEIGSGTGLGLSVSHGIAATHGGRLSFEPSHPHTRFVLELPDRSKAKEAC